MKIDKYDKSIDLVTNSRTEICTNLIFTRKCYLSQESFFVTH